MKVESLHVDGFGVLSGADIGPFSDRLTVVLGPNEAGKSTLLDFVRGVLFGFPDRRHRAAYHEPLRGGRHGGALRLRDDHGASYLLERHLDRREPSLSGESGELLDSEVLRHLLGGADDSLFRSVFAFGLGELASFETLERDEVRELVFSAGVLGAGRSATSAVRALDQQRAQLVRPRQQDAPANRLRARLEGLDQQLREARASSGDYEAIEIRCAVLRATSRAHYDARESLHRRAREIARLEACWSPWHRLGEASAHLSTLPAPTPESALLAALAPEIAALCGELSGHAARERQRRGLESQLAGIERELEGRLDSLGWARTRRLVPALEPGLDEHIAALARHHREAGAERRALGAERDRAVADRQLARAALAEATERAPARERVLLDEAARCHSELRGLLAVVERNEGEERALRHEEAARRRTAPPLRGGALGLVGAVVALLATVAILVAALRHDTLVAGCGLAALALGISLLAFDRLERRRSPAAPGALALAGHEDGARLRARIAELSIKLGLAERPEGIELEGVLGRLEAERERRRDLDELAHRRDLAEERVGALAVAIGELDARLATIEGEAGSLARQLELPTEPGPDGLPGAVAEIREVGRLASARGRVAPELELLVEEIERYELAATELLGRLGTDRRPTDLAGQLGAMASAAAGARAAAEERSALEHEIAESERTLAEALGEGEDAARLRADLARGERSRWSEEHRELERRLGEAGEVYDAALAELHEAERTLRDLAGSEEIASLATEREGVAAELDGVLWRWVSLGLAGALLASTLSRYESERQPVVIARAAELFATVTDGRYEKLVAREDADQRHHGIEAITPSGERVDAADLSRGTAEQLYLCLRLAFATTFAERAVALPLVLDDVLVNFDPTRSSSVAAAIATVADEHQVLVFTCHPHVVECFREAAPDLQVLTLERC